MKFQQLENIVIGVLTGTHEMFQKNNMDYKKFYNLEEYLFQDVGSRFRKTNTLSVEDFFCIVIWKANRAKTNIKKKLSKMATLSEP